MMNHTNKLDKLKSDCGKTPRSEESQPGPEKPSDYYYDDSTGYEVYDDSEDENDNESPQQVLPNCFSMG